MRTVFQQMWQGLHRGLLALTAVLALALAPMSAVHADVYGNGTYNTSTYNSSTSTSSSSSSAAAPESTVVQTPSGMQVAINLTNGQAIPSTGYYITITPLNGQGKSFDKAEIYLDNVLAFTGAPDATGTLRWLWDTAKYPASKVKIVVYGPGDGVTTQEFNVTVTPVQAATSNQANDLPASAPTASSGWPLWAIIAAIVGGLVIVGLIVWLVARRRHNGQLPPPTVYNPMR